MNDVASALPNPAVSLEPVAQGELVEASERTQSQAARFRELVNQNFDFIWRSLRGLGVPLHSVDDAAQQVFLIASQKLDSIALGSERAFLFSTALGVSANARRARARNREVCDDVALSQEADVGPDGESVVEMRERRALL